jgi:malate permease and related proteins
VPHALYLALAMVALGFLSAKLRRMPEQAADVINRFVLDFSLPALVLINVSKLRLQADLLSTALVAWVVMAASALVLRSASRFCKFSREVEGCLLLTGVLGNTAFLGYPLVKAYFPDQFMGQAVIYDQLGSFLVFSTFGLWVAAHYGGGKAPSFADTIKRIASFPAFIALVSAFALACLGLQIPGSMLLVLNDLSALLVPLAMFSVGLNLKLVPAPGQSVPLLLGLAVKMLLAPLLALGLAHWLMPADARNVAALQAAMPPMVTAAALAANARLAPNLAGALAGFGILGYRF